MELSNPRAARARIGIVRACTVVLFGLLCAEVARRGPLTLAAPATILANAGPVQRDTQPYLFFLRWVRARVPPGAVLAVLTPGDPSPGPNYLIALGQLPEQEVWHTLARGAPGSEETTEWVACFFRALDDPRYRLVDRWTNGFLYRRKR